MAKYLIKANYTSEGVKGVLSGGGSARREAVEKAVAGLGGRLEGFYFAFGDTDAYVIVDLPDEISAAAVSLTTGASGAVRISTVQLLTPEQVDEAAKKSVEYTPPGG
jgi:uncharacterized protein with GYD domain